MGKSKNPRKHPLTPTVTMCDVMLAQVARDRVGSSYWKERGADLDAVESWLLSLMDWLDS